MASTPARQNFASVALEPSSPSSSLTPGSERERSNMAATERASRVVDPSAGNTRAVSLRAARAAPATPRKRSACAGCFAGLSAPICGADQRRWRDQPVSGSAANGRFEMLTVGHDLEHLRVRIQCTFGHDDRGELNQRLPGIDCLLAQVRIQPDQAALQFGWGQRQHGGTNSTPASRTHR